MHATQFDIRSADGTCVTGWRNNGRGVPVVISNGLGTPPEAWPSLIEATDRYRVATWYYRGTAGGSRPDDPSRVRVEDHVDDLIALMDAEGMEQAVLVSWSIGVNVAFEAARRHPERVAGLMAVAGVPGGTFQAMGKPLGVPRRLRHLLGTTTARALRIVAPGLQLGARLLPANRLTATLLTRSGVMLPPARPELVLPALKEFRTHDWRWYLTLALGAAGHTPMDLSFVQVPTTVVAGRWDVLTAWDDMIEAAEQVPDAVVRVLPGSHFLPLEYPDELLELLDELVGRAGLSDRATT